MTGFAVAPQPFDQGWTLDDTRRMYEHSINSPDFASSSKAERDQWNDEYMVQMDQLTRAIGQHVLHLAATSGLLNPPHAEQADNRFLRAWRKAVDGQDLSEWEAQFIGLAVSKPLTTALVAANPRFADENNPAPTPEQVHALFINTVQAGDFERTDTEMPAECAVTGQELALVMNAWIPTIHRLDPDSGSFKPLSAGDLDPAPRPTSVRT